MEKELIESIFRIHKFEEVKSINKIEIGFSNEVYSINDNFILKVCKDDKNEKRFEKEAFFYDFFRDQLPIPKIEVYDDSKKICDYNFIIYPKIQGENLYSKWHTLNDNQRKNIVREICDSLRIINNSSSQKFVNKFNANPNINWQKTIVNKIDKSLTKIESKNILNKENIKSIRNFVSKTKYALIDQDVKIVYWDIHFDNIIIKENKVAAIIDFERTELCSIDFVLDVVKRMTDYPKKYVSAENEKFSVKKDYRKLMEWYKEFYPELFEFENLDFRLNLYSIEHDLDTLLGWPDSIELKEIIMNIVNSK